MSIDNLIISGNKMAEQVWMIYGHDDKIDLNKFPKGKLRIGNRGHLNKPHGAFWTSDLEGDESDWMRFCRWDYEAAQGSQAVIIKVKPNAKILKIENSSNYTKVVSSAYGDSCS
jgi:hypothetical protein